MESITTQLIFNDLQVVSHEEVISDYRPHQQSIESVYIVSTSISNVFM